MKRKFILILYILLFWILLPGIIVGSALLWKQNFAFSSFRSVAGGILILCFALPMLILSIAQFRSFSGKYPVSADPPKVFICNGLYAVWRHPIYLFYTLLLIGAALIWGSKEMLFLSIPCFVILEAIYVLIEERTLLRRFGDSYLCYRKRTSLVIPRFYYWLKIPMFFIARCIYRTTVSGKKHIPDAPPFFLVASHRNYLDPLLLGLILPYPIRYVTTFEMYRKGKTRWFFKGLDCIPKKRYLQDVSTGREIIRAIRQEAVIGIFPEGERAWTGILNPPKPETLNLFRKFKQVPVLPVKLKGNFYGWPRWGKGIRSSNIHVAFQEPIHIQDAWGKSEIEKQILRAIDPGDLEDPAFYCRTEKRLEYIQKVLYRCPLCRSFDSLSVEADQGRCTACKALLSMDAKYHPRFTLGEQHMEGSLDEIYTNIRIEAKDLEPAPFIAESGEASLYKESLSRLQVLLTGRLRLTREQLILSDGNQNLSLNLADVSSITTESNFKLQLYDSKAGQLYQLVFPGESVLKWQDLLALTIREVHGRTPNLR